MKFLVAWPVQYLEGRHQSLSVNARFHPLHQFAWQHHWVHRQGCPSDLWLQCKTPPMLFCCLFQTGEGFEWRAEQLEAHCLQECELEWNQLDCTLLHCQLRHPRRRNAVNRASRTHGQDLNTDRLCSQYPHRLPKSRFGCLKSWDWRQVALCFWKQSGLECCPRRPCFQMDCRSGEC